MLTKYTFNRLLAGSSSALSTALSPLLVPAYGVMLVMWTSVMSLLPMGTRIAVLAVVLGITCVLPIIAIGVLHHFRYIASKRLEHRRERQLPYAFALLCCLGAASYLHHSHAPVWFTMFMAGAALACATTLVVNTFWRISAHMAGIGALVALLYQIHVQGLSTVSLFGLLCVVILLAGALGTARMALRRRTLLQVLAGFANGYACVTLMIKFFG